MHHIFKDVDRSLMRCSNIVMDEVLGAKDGEKVLIITNHHDDGMKISKSLYNASIIRKMSPVIIVQSVKSQLDFAEDAVIKSIESEPDIVISISKEKLGKDRWALKKPYIWRRKKLNHIFNYLLEKKKIRAFWSPSITEDMYRKTVPLNYEELRKTCEKVARVLSRSEEIRITSSKGTDITIGVRKRKAMKDDGDFKMPGSGGNLPCGEVFISPEIGNSEGKIVFDGSIAIDRDEIIIKNPIECHVKEGFVRKIIGSSEAKRLKDAVKRGEKMPFKLLEEKKVSKSLAQIMSENATHLGEFGIGLNPKARIVGNMLEDEKVYGTCHIALGSNYDEDAPAMIHFDGLIKKPTILTRIGRKEVIIMERGELRL